MDANARAWSLMTKTHGGVVSIVRDLTLAEVRQAYERLDPWYGTVHKRYFYTDSRGTRIDVTRGNGGCLRAHNHSAIDLREVFGPIDWDRSEIGSWDTWPQHKAVEADPFGRELPATKEKTDAVLWRKRHKPEGPLT